MTTPWNLLLCDSPSTDDKRRMYTLGPLAVCRENGSGRPESGIIRF